MKSFELFVGQDIYSFCRSRAEIWRLLRMFKKYAFKFTCYAVGRAVEENPAAIQAMERDQHEIASHNHKVR